MARTIQTGRKNNPATRLKKQENKRESAAASQNDIYDIYAERMRKNLEGYNMLEARKVIPQKPANVQETLSSPSDSEAELSTMDTDELLELTQGRYEEYEDTNPESATNRQVAAALQSVGTYDIPMWIADSSEEVATDTEILNQEVNDAVQVAGYQTSPEPSIDYSTTSEPEMSSSEEPREERGDDDYEDSGYYSERTTDLTDIRLTRATSNFGIVEGSENHGAEVLEAEGLEAEGLEAEVPEAEVPEAEVSEAEILEAEVSEAEASEAEVPEVEVSGPSNASKKNSAFSTSKKSLEQMAQRLASVNQAEQGARATDEENELKAQKTLKMRNEISDLLFQAQEMFMQSQRVADGFVEYAKFIGNGDGQYDARKHFDAVLKREIYDIGAVEWPRAKRVRKKLVGRGKRRR